MKKCSLLAAAVGSCFLVSQSAHAGFGGKQLRDIELFPDTGSTIIENDFVVGPGIEVGPSFRGSISLPETLDVSDADILWQYNFSTHYVDAAFNGSHIVDYTSTVDPIVNVSINPATDVTGFDASRISFDADNIFVNFHDLNISDGNVVSLHVDFQPTVTGTPEPSSLFVLGALGAFAASARSRRTFSRK